jgi:hypothetical protein
MNSIKPQFEEITLSMGITTYVYAANQAGRL